jgi:hypothetical protein
MTINQEHSPLLITPLSAPQLKMSLLPDWPAFDTVRGSETRVCSLRCGGLFLRSVRFEL